MLPQCYNKIYIYEGFKVNEELTGSCKGKTPDIICMNNSTASFDLTEVLHLYQGAISNECYMLQH